MARNLSAVTAVNKKKVRGEVIHAKELYTRFSSQKRRVSRFNSEYLTQQYNGWEIELERKSEPASPRIKMLEGVLNAGVRVMVKMTMKFEKDDKKDITEFIAMDTAKKLS